METPRFEPPLGSIEAHDPKWETLVIRYSDAKRPVVVIRTGPIVDIDEILEEDFGSRPLDSTLQRRLVEARQVFILDVNPDSLTDEAWEVCDFIERFIANRCDGLIYALDDGIFDANLQRVATATPRKGPPT